MKRSIRLVVLLAALTLPALPATAADEAGFEMRAGESVKTVLGDVVGRQVTLLMLSGQEVTGTVVKVGDHAVHLAKLAGGRDFYDAVVLLDRVDGVIIRVRGR